MMIDFPGKIRFRRWIHRRQTGCAILLYHRVIKLSYDPLDHCVPPELFYQQVEAFKSRFRIIRLGELVDNLRRGRALKERSVVITFDDGFADNVQEALPVLESLDAPATVFVTTGYIGQNRELWWEDLERILLQAESLPPTLNLDVAGEQFSYPVRGERERTWLHRNFMRMLRDLDAPDRNRFLAALSKWAGLPVAARPDHRSLTVEELKKLAASPLIDIGGHSVWHSCIASLPVASQEHEIRQNKQSLEAMLGKRTDLFAYSFGQPEDFTEETISILKDCGYVASCTTTRGVVKAKSGMDFFRLPRLYIQKFNPRQCMDFLGSYWANS